MNTLLFNQHTYTKTSEIYRRSTLLQLQTEKKLNDKEMVELLQNELLNEKQKSYILQKKVDDLKAIIELYEQQFLQ